MKKTLCMLLIFIFISSAAFASDTSIREHMHSNYSKALRMSAMPSFNGYCAACVAYQVMAIGISREYIAGNGNDAFARYSAISRSSGGWLTKSYPAALYSMRQVLLSQNTSGYGSAYYPIVLGFDRGTASQAGQKYGHTMLIYAVRAGTVYFTDSTMPELSDNIYSLPIDDFCLRYSDNPDTAEHEFVYDGAVVFYRSAPDAARVGMQKNQHVLWEDVTFDFSAPGATGYSIGIEKDGVRVMTLHTLAPSYTAQFGEKGTYTAYISACNAFGYVDSQTITFDVGAAPEHPYITADKTSVLSGESVSISYGADYASSYAIGITHPDGSYEVINAGDADTLERTLDTAGIYSIFVSCCNSVGYIDTEVINIICS